jgi:hypothetical protein
MIICFARFLDEGSTPSAPTIYFMTENDPNLEKVYPVDLGGRYDGELGFCRQVFECDCGCHPCGSNWHSGVYYGDWRP